MNRLHPDRETLRKLIRGELSAARGLQIQRHLLLCPECEELYLTLSFAEQAAEPDAAADEPAEHVDYSSAIDRVLERTRGELCRKEKDLAAEQEAAGGLAAELLALPPGERLPRLEADERLESWAVCERLVELCQELSYRDQEEAARVGELAVEAARRLDADRYGEGRTHDLKARAWSAVGYVRRLLADYPGAERAFQNAESHLMRGSGDPSEEARLLELKSSLRRSERRFEESLALIDEAIELYKLLTEKHLTGRALVRRGVTLGFLDRLPEAITSLQQGLSMLQAAAEPRIDLYGRHNLFCFLLEAGRLLEAQAMLADTQRLHREVGDDHGRLRLQWLEGRLAAALGQVEQAEAALLSTRDAYFHHGEGLNTALVSMELASLYVRHDRPRDLHRLSDEIFPMFQLRDLPREAIGALTTFQEAVQQERLTPELVDEILATVRGGMVRPAALLQSV